MGNVTKNFSTWEWACRCGCGLSALHPVIIVRNQDIRARAGVRMDYTSGCRCESHNKKEGGADDSSHLPQENGYCEASDWTIPGMFLVNMFMLAEETPEYLHGGIGVYLDDDGPRIHTDVRRGGPFRWAYLDGEKVSIAKVLQEAERRGL